MTELEKITCAKTYMDKLANGINPLTNQPVSDADSINDVRISRCLFYVADILRQIVENGGISQGKTRIAKAPFYLDHETREKFHYSERPIQISEITKRINALIQTEKMKKLNYKSILDWLVQAGFLEFVMRDDGKMTRTPTDNGIRLGISTEQRQSSSGSYTAVVYNKMAQQFILDNLDAAIELSRR